MAAKDGLGIAEVAYTVKEGAELAPYLDPSTRSKFLPLAFLQWITTWAIPGIGMFCEAYFVFAIGNLQNTVFAAEYPTCIYSTAGLTAVPAGDVCDLSVNNALTYTSVAGIIAGMLVLGFFADRIGRRIGSILTASGMFVGSILILASSGPTLEGQFIMFNVAQSVFGFGVGGEYPIASASAAERAEAQATLLEHRGQTIVLTFSMQGWGNVINTTVILALLGITGSTAPTASGLFPDQLQIVWRVSYAIGVLPVMFMLFYRVLYLKESVVWKAKRKTLLLSGNSTAISWTKIGYWLYHYWHRLFACAGGWFVWDFAFYGNKLFQGTFIKTITGTSSVLVTIEYTLLNSTVALTGYYFAAFTIDRKWMGRRNMQIMGFSWMFVLFLICAAAFSQLTCVGVPKAQLPCPAIQAFEFLYFFSSFWGQVQLPQQWRFCMQKKTEHHCNAGSVPLERVLCNALNKLGCCFLWLCLNY
jgi:MFS family permease